MTRIIKLEIENRFGLETRLNQEFLGAFDSIRRLARKHHRLAEMSCNGAGRVNGQSALTLNVFKAQDANLVAVGEDVAKTIESLRKQLPPDVEIQSIFENAKFVKDKLKQFKHRDI